MHIEPVELDDLSDGSEAPRPGDYVEGRRWQGQDWTDTPLTGCDFSECHLDAVRMGDQLIDRLQLGECLLTGLDEPAVRMPSARMRHVQWDRCRVGSAEWHGADWEDVLLTGCRLGYVNLRGSALSRVVLSDCQVDELDLIDVRATGIRLEGCRVRRLTVRHGTLSDVDLRGADVQAVDGVEHLGGTIISEGQLMGLAPALARQHGITVGDTVDQWTP